ncbi:MAG: hypothetical protein LBH54_03130, partial [Clostridiales bacterium]|nr:hypothetical protein [Clostridiales bacterium]
AVTRNGVADSFLNLARGDNAEVVVSAGQIKRLAATSVNKTLEGAIEEIVISSSPSITIKTGGVSTRYTVSADTVFYVEDEQVTLYDMRLGATASVSLKSENIDRIKISRAIVPSQLIGTVTAVNAAYNLMSLDVADQLTGNVSSQTVVVKSNVKIIDNTSTKVAALKALTTGRSVIALGALDNYGMYAVNTIIITQ